MTAIFTHWLGDLHTPLVANISKSVLQWVGGHRAQGLVYTLGAIIAPITILHRFLQFMLDKSGCEVQIRGEDHNAEYITAWMEQHFSDRRGTNQTVETCLSRPTDIQRKPQRDEEAGHWRFDRTHEDLYTLCNVSSGRHFFIHQRRMWKFQRTKGHSETSHSDTLSIRCVGSWSPIKVQQLIGEAKREFLKRGPSTTQIFIPATKHQRQRGVGEPWSCVQEAKHPRGIMTVNLEEGVKEDIINDMNLFLSPEQYQVYTNRGIRYGRNYLLHGPPGTGKTALVEALSGIFGLDIYRIPLDSLEMTDDDLIILLSRVSSRCLILFGDIDRAGLPTRCIEGHVGKMTRIPSEGHPQPVRSIILSGFLNAIDGVATREGPIVVFTTNCLEDSDPAIVRPGRADKKVRLGLASRSQIQSIYARMYSSKSTANSDLETKANVFADKLGKGCVSPAAIQGFLLQYPSKPDDAIAAVDDWLNSQPTPVRHDEST